MSFGEIFALSLGAILIENCVLVKFLGICPFLGVSRSTETAVGMGFAVTFVMTVSTAATNLVNRLLVSFELEYMQTVVFILIIAGLVQLVEMFLIKAMPSLYRALGIYLPLITTNCAVLGYAILNVSLKHSFITAIIYSFSAGLGFTLAIILFASIRERLVYADYPKAFEGFPIALVTASLLSMAFMGFQGLKLF